MGYSVVILWPLVRPARERAQFGHLSFRGPSKESAS